MDFIERLFHIAPDHGGGTLEAAILTAVLAVPSVLAILRITGRRGLFAALRRIAARMP